MSIIQYLKCSKCGEENFQAQNQVLQCLSCNNIYQFKEGVVYTTKPAPSVGSKYARQLARKNWSKWRHSNYAFLKERLKGFSEESTVIDLGCGESPFGDLLERFKTYIKLDFTNYKGVNIVSDLTKTLPIKSDSVDIVIASNVLEHIPNTENFLDECSRILKPDGKILITVPFLIPIHQEPFDFLRFTKYQLNYLLEKANFSKIEVIPLSNFLEIYQSVQNAFLNATVNQQDSIFSKFFLRIFRKIQVFMTGSVSKVLEDVEDHHYPKGYGIMAAKKTK